MSKAKIAILITIFLIGIGTGYLIFNCRIGSDPKIDLIEKDLEKALLRYDSIIQLQKSKDSIAAIKIIKEEENIDKINENTQKLIEKGVDSDRYHELVLSNRSRGRKRFNN